jgi:putative ATP-dependent endonuclease of OLD family
VRIRKITVENFRALRKIEIQPANYCVIVGENAAGKSSLVQALRLLFDVDARQLVAGITEDDINADAVKAGENQFAIAVEIGDLQKHAELRAAFDRSIAADGAEQYVTIVGGYYADAGDPNAELEWHTFVMPPPNTKAEPVPFTSRMARLLPLYYLNAVRDAARETRPTGQGLLGRLLDDISLNDIASQLTAAVATVNAHLLQSVDLGKLAVDLTALVQPHLFGGAGQLQFALAAEDIDSIMRSLRLLLQTGASSLDLGRHATGLQNLVLIALFRHLVQRASSVFPILVCEEPESHLHPNAQRRIARDLGALPGPTIITTHSTVVVEGTDPLSIVRLAQRASGVTAHQWTNVGVAERTDFAQFLRSGRSEAVFARAIILVEGESEAIALPAFARQLGLDLERDGVCVVRADGNAFGFMLRAIGSAALNIPVVVTYDADSLANTNTVLVAARDAGLLQPTAVAAVRRGTAAQKRALLDPLGWIAADPNFEGVVCASGYDATALSLINAEGETTSLDNFLRANGLTRDAFGLASYIVSKTGEWAKIPFARAVRDAVPSVGRVPLCYENALRTGVRLAM